MADVLSEGGVNHLMPVAHNQEVWSSSPTMVRTTGLASSFDLIFSSAIEGPLFTPLEPMLPGCCRSQL